MGPKFAIGTPVNYGYMGLTDFRTPGFSRDGRPHGKQYVIDGLRVEPAAIWAADGHSRIMGLSGWSYHIGLGLGLAAESYDDRGWHTEGEMLKAGYQPTI